MSRDILNWPITVADERAGYGRDPDQFFDLYWPEQANDRSIVLIHGGFWRSKFDLRTTSHLARWFAQRGYRVANLEYRRVGKSGGGWPRTFEDCQAGCEAAAGRLGDRRPIVMGHSAGGQLALLLAAKDAAIGLVVGLAPVADLRVADELNLGDGAVREFLGGTPDENAVAYQAADPSRRPARVPVFIVHGLADDVVPVAVSRAYREAQKGNGLEPTLIEVPDADHFDVITPGANLLSFVPI